MYQARTVVRVEATRKNKRPSRNPQSSEVQGETIPTFQARWMPLTRFFYLSFIASSIHTPNVGLNQTSSPPTRPGEKPKPTQRSRALERVRPECGLGNHCSRFVPGLQEGMRLPGEKVRSRGTQRRDLLLRCLC